MQVIDIQTKQRDFVWSQISRDSRQNNENQSLPADSATRPTTDVSNQLRLRNIGMQLVGGSFITCIHTRNKYTILSIC